MNSLQISGDTKHEALDDAEDENDDENDVENASDEDYLDDETVELLSKEFTYISSTGLKWTAKNTEKNTPSYGITEFYKPTWKPRANHYIHYSDIQLNGKETLYKPATNSATITHQELIEKLNEWRLHYVISQVNSLVRRVLCFFFWFLGSEENRL